MNQVYIPAYAGIEQNQKADEPAPVHSWDDIITSYKNAFNWYSHTRHEFALAGGATYLPPSTLHSDAKIAASSYKGGAVLMSPTFEQTTLNPIFCWGISVHIRPNQIVVIKYRAFAKWSVKVSFFRGLLTQEL